MKSKSIAQAFWGVAHVGPGHFVASWGNVTDEALIKYIEQQSQKPPDGDFKIDDEL